MEIIEQGNQPKVSADTDTAGQNEVIEIDWDKINAAGVITFEEPACETQAETTTVTEAAPAELKESTWEIIDMDKEKEPEEKTFDIEIVPETQEPEVLEPVVDLNQFNLDETVLFNPETRQKLLNDLTELEFFLKQRLFELNSKDQVLFAIYADNTGVSAEQ